MCGSQKLRHSVSAFCIQYDFFSLSRTGRNLYPPISLREKSPSPQKTSAISPLRTTIHDHARKKCTTNYHRYFICYDDIPAIRIFWLIMPQRQAHSYRYLICYDDIPAIRIFWLIMPQRQGHSYRYFICYDDIPTIRILANNATKAGTFLSLFYLLR
jgi:hypothetical protein